MTVAMPTTTALVMRITMPTTIIHEASEVVDYSKILSHAFPGLQCKHNHAPCLGNTWPEAALHMWDAEIRRTLARPWPLRTWPEAVRATPGQRPCAQLPPTTNTWPEAVSPSGLAVQAFAPENLEAGHLGWCSCLLYTSPSPRDISGSRMPSSA